MKEYLLVLILVPVTLLFIKQYKNNKKQNIPKGDISELDDFYNLPVTATDKEKRRELLLALAKNYNSEYKTIVKLKRYEQLYFDQILPKDMLDSVRLERETVLIGKYIIESEAGFCDYEELDKEARELAKLYINNDNDIPIKKNVVYLPLDPNKFEMINELYAKIKHVGGDNK